MGTLRAFLEVKDDTNENSVSIEGQVKLNDISSTEAIFAAALVIGNVAATIGLETEDEFKELLDEVIKVSSDMKKDGAFDSLAKGTASEEQQ